MGSGAADDLLDLLKTMDQQIAALDRAVLAAAEASPQAQLLMTQPGSDR